MKKLTIIIASFVALTVATVAQARDQIKIVGSSQYSLTRLLLLKDSVVQDLKLL